MIKMNRYALVAALAMFLWLCGATRARTGRGSQAGAGTACAAATAGAGSANGANHTAAAGSD